MRIEKSGERHRPSAQEFIVRTYQEFERLMYYTARKYNSDPQQCEDIVQDSVAKLIEKVDILQTFNRTTLASYIVATVRNTSINHLKQQGKEKERVINLSEIRGETSRNSELTLEDMLIQKEQVERIRTLWPRLDKETKLILEGRYILRYDDGQLAKLLGCRTNSVRMKLTRARRKAFELLEEDEKYGKP